MDSITHIAVGALIGEAFAGKELGKRAMFYGALAQSIPDLDVIAIIWSSPAENLLAHRGFMHSILFAVLITVAAAWIAERWHRLQNISRTTWIIFFGVEVFMHLLLDAFNAYGVGWFEPFSHARISFHTLFVADPFFSFVAGIAFIVLLFFRSTSIVRRRWMIAGLSWCALYLAYALFNKTNVNAAVERSINLQKIPHQRYLTSPTPFNNWLWYVVVEDKEGYHIGYRSVFDTKDSINYTWFPRQDSIQQLVEDQESLKLLLRFSQGYYTLEGSGKTIVFNDLRLGQISGWYDPHGPFAFHYYLTDVGQNATVIQRGRLSGWNRDTVIALIDRIKGN